MYEARKHAAATQRTHVHRRSKLFAPPPPNTPRHSLPKRTVDIPLRSTSDVLNIYSKQYVPHHL
jgi:hypothetical protein